MKGGGEVVDCARVLKNICLYMQDRNITNQKLCHDTGIKTATWSNRKKTPKEFKLGELMAICNYFGIQLADLEAKKL